MEFQAAAGGLKGRGWGGIGDGFLVTCQHHSNSWFLPSWQTPGGKWAIINSFRHQPILCSHLYQHISINWNKFNLLFFPFCVHPSIHSSVCSIHVHQGAVCVCSPQVPYSQVGCPCADHFTSVSSVSASVHRNDKCTYFIEPAVRLRWNTYPAHAHIILRVSIFLKIVFQFTHLFNFSIYSFVYS